MSTHPGITHNRNHYMHCPTQLYLDSGRYDTTRLLIERAERVLCLPGDEPLPIDLVVKLGEWVGGGWWRLGGFGLVGWVAMMQACTLAPLFIH